ncbi:MAG: trypsin-like peptidase domain-containing protein [Deltaproteobacteria bacterium]|nr:trypsin-like peptidase domain-containing protein [Deltaproteobacteria bacterium]
MSDREKKILWIGLAITFIMGLWPPWTYTFIGDTIHAEKPAGYAFLFTPPLPESDDLPFGIKLDMLRLCIQWFLTALATTGILVSLRGWREAIPRVAWRRFMPTERVLFICLVGVLVLWHGMSSVGKSERASDTYEPFLESALNQPKPPATQGPGVPLELDLEAQLAENFPPKNRIERARNASVLIQTESGFGSGFFITGDGYILTNKHVVKGHDRFRVVLADSSLRFDIYRVEKMSEKYDLALLKLEDYKCPFLEAADSVQLAQGDPLYAIGMPEDLRHTVTSGIFSGYRKLLDIAIIQTNAQINPGNSGGPLITKEGKVVGINTSKIICRGIEGLGFAIPIDVAFQEFADELAK